MATGIYKITSPSGRVYIGQSKNVFARFNSYKRMACKDQPKLYASFLKHGVDSHSFELLHKCEHEHLDNLEIHYISFYNSIKNGLNCKDGGHKASMSKESRIKLSETLKIINKNPEVRERRSAWQRGRKMSESSKILMRIAKIGKKAHPNQRDKALGNNYAGKGKIEIIKDGVVVAVKENLYKAAEYIGGDHRNIHRALTHPTKKTHKGFQFARI